MAAREEIAAHLDLSTRQIYNLVKNGVLPASKGNGGLDVDACRVAYIRYLRGLQSGQVRAPEGEQVGEVPPQNNFEQLIEQERHRKLKRENDLEEKLVAPVSLLTDALLKAGAVMIPILESLPLLMKRYWPEITGDQIQEVKRAIAECRNEIARMRIDLDD